MPPLRGLLRVPVLRAGALHPAAVVLLVPPHDGRPLLLRSRLLHPEAHVPAAADRGARLQRVLLQAAPEPGARSPAAGAALLHRPRRTRHESCREPHGDGFPGSTQLSPGERALPPAPFLLQHAPTPVRTGGEGQVAGCCLEPAWAARRTGGAVAGRPRPISTRFPDGLMSHKGTPSLIPSDQAQPLHVFYR